MFMTGVTVNCLSQLVEVMEIMIETLGGESTLIIMEGLNPLLLAQKVPIQLHLYDLCYPSHACCVLIFHVSVLSQY